MVYFVTGSAGFIGFHLCLNLLKKNLQVVGLDNHNDYYDIKIKADRVDILNSFKNYQHYKLDIADNDEIKKIFENHKPQYVVNLAAQAGVRYSIENPNSYIKSNLIGFYNILNLSKGFKVKHFFYASSSSVYGNQKK